MGGAGKHLSSDIHTRESRSPAPTRDLGTGGSVYDVLDIVESTMPVAPSWSWSYPSIDRAAARPGSAHAVWRSLVPVGRGGLLSAA